jgi:dTDP-4-dehydrorhamnose reductase
MGASLVVVMRAAACVVGADGYLGQFVVDDLSRADSPFDVVYALARRESTMTSTSARARRIVCDITSAASCADAVRAMTSSSDDEVLRLVVNCAGMSSPGACEKEPRLADAANAPSTLWTATAKATGENPPLWIQLSTDHVYDGTRAMSDENVTPAPVNAYGKSKVRCEETLAREYPRSVVLRSSIITGPKPPFVDVERTLFLDFIRDSFENKSERTTFYDDEFRSPICVYDVCAAIRAAYESPPETPKTYNMGGPDRVSRVDMAKGVAAYLANGDATLEATYVGKIARASCEEAARLRGVAAPPDISMDSSALYADVCGDAPPRSFRDQIIASLPPRANGA